MYFSIIERNIVDKIFNLKYLDCKHFTSYGLISEINITTCIDFEK